MKELYSEVDLARVVIQWLTSFKWDVYQEVELRSGGPRADIVATQRGLVWIVETKLQYGLAVVDQARAWRGYAHFICVATPPYSKHRSVLDDYLRHIGVGRLVVRNVGTDYASVTEEMHPALNRKVAGIDRWRRILCEEHKTYAEAGNHEGRRFTPFQATCQSIRKYLTDHPGASLKDLVASIQTHYRSTTTAKTCIAKWAQAGAIEGVRVERDGRNLKFYVEGKAA